MARRLLNLTLLVTLLTLLGCGGGGGGNSDGLDGSPPSIIVPTSTATLRLENVLARAIPSSITQLRLTGYDATGRVLFGPVSQPKDAIMDFLEVPVTVRRVQVEYLEGTRLAGLALTNVTLLAGQISVLRDLDFQDVDAALTRITIEPSNLTLAKGTTGKLTAVGHYSDDQVLDLSNSVTWRAADTAVEVSNSGIVTALLPGTAEVTASLGGITSSSRVNVTEATLDSLRFEPATVTLAAGTGRTFVVRGLFSDDTSQDLTSEVTFATEDPSVAEIALPTGSVLGKASGETEITASYRGQIARASIVVTPAVLVQIDVTPASVSLPKGTSQQLTATGIFSDKTTQDLTASATWDSLDPSVASASSGWVGAIQTGTTTISATFGEITGTATVEVTSAEVTGLTMEPTTLSLPEGLTEQLAVIAHFSDGTSSPVTDLATYESSNITVASVNTLDQRGLVTANVIGNSTIVIRFSGKQTSLEVEVSPALLRTLSIDPSTLPLPKGTSGRLTASGTYTDGVTRDLTSQVLWRSSKPDIAEVDSEGAVFGLRQGEAVITAEIEGAVASADIAVGSAIISRLELSPVDPRLKPGDTTQLNATAVYSDGGQRDITTEALWQSADSSVVVVTAQGEVTARQLGESRISAHFDGVTAGLIVTVERRGTGEGFFPAWALPDGYADDVELGDIDGDGWTDAVGTGDPFRPGVVFIRLNARDGFLSQIRNVTLSGHNSLEEVTLADVDGDGDLDLAIIERSPSRLLVLLNDGTGNYSSEPSLAFSSHGILFDMRAADLDGDDDIDLLANDSSSSNLRLVALLNDGSGDFSRSAISESTDSSAWSYQLYDFDGINGPDIIYHESRSADVVLLTNAGNGQFGGRQTLLDNVNIGSVAVGDWNGDAHPDLATGKSSFLPGVTTAWLNDGNDQFSISSEVNGGVNNRFGVPQDLDGDGILDLIVTSSQPRTQVLYGLGDGTFSPSLELWSMVSLIRTADMNRDGHLDLIGGHFLQYFIDPQRQTAKVSVHLINSSESPGYATGDFDRDGDLDFAVLDRSATNNRILTNDGSAGLAQTSTFRSNGSLARIVTGDFNLDGKLDLLTAGNGSGGSAELTTLLGRGDGTFPTRVVRVEPAGIGLDLVPADYDADGDLDVAFMGTDGIRILFNNGTGSFPQGRTSPGATSANWLASSDVDGDGDIDLLALSQQEYRLFVLKNDGSGNLAPPVAYSTGLPSPFGMAVADIDGDGDQDVAVTHQRDLAWVTVLMKNDGSGSFTFASSVTGSSLGQSTQPNFGDFDGDGDQDLLTATLHFNDGNGNFGEVKWWGQWETGHSRRRVLGDFDGDGDLDISMLARYEQVRDAIVIWTNNPRPEIGPAWPKPAHRSAI